MRAMLHTAGEAVEVDCANPWISRVLAEATAGQRSPAGEANASVRVTVEHDREPFDTTGWEVLTRDAWRCDGKVVIANACSSGVDLLVNTGTPALEISCRWRPRPSGRAAAAVLRSRARLLIRAVLLQYPAIWRGQQRGRVPVHASVCTLGGPGERSILLAGPGGVGKSTLVDAELVAGGHSTSDNLCVTDGHHAWGVLEPRRIDAARGDGRRMPHGRREAPWAFRPERQVPGLVVVLRRGNGPEPEITDCAPSQAARALSAGTYMAGELRRYWAIAATLALGTGLGQVQPDIGRIATELCEGLPCVQVTLARAPGADIRRLLSSHLGMEVRA